MSKAAIEEERQPRQRQIARRRVWHGKDEERLTWDFEPTTLWLAAYFLEGINDIGAASLLSGQPDAAAVIRAYWQILGKAHARGARSLVARYCLT
jgi:hypothetical protein